MLMRKQGAIFLISIVLTSVLTIESLFRNHYEDNSLRFGSSLLPGIVIRYVFNRSAGEALDLDDVPKPCRHEENTDILTSSTGVGVLVVLFTELGYSLILYRIHSESGGIIGLIFGFNENAIQTIILTVLNNQECTIEF